MLSDRVLNRIKQDFAAEDAQEEVAAALMLYEYSEQERVQFDIIQLAEGNAKAVRPLVDAANRDYRDILFWAEYPKEARIDTPEKRKMVRDLFEWLGEEVPEDLKD